MKKISKRIIALILTLVMAVTIVPLSGLNITVEAATGSDVVEYARQFIGCPYVSGATGPDAFDCSGFVSFVFKHFGIDIPNSTYVIWNNMSKYGNVIDHGSVENAIPGDVIVWVGHVSIYTGNGNCVEALNSRYGVTEAIPVNSHTNGMDYYVLRINGLSSAVVINEKYTVKYDANGGVGAPASQTKYSDMSLTLTSYTPTRLGYTFKEWNTLSTGKGTSYPSGSSYSINENVTLYAVWTANQSTHTHRYSSKITKAATCETEGIKTFTCSCGSSYTESIPATGHSYGDWVITKLATVSAAGEKQRTCKTCGKVEKESIAKLAADAVVLDKATIAMNYRGTAKLMANKAVKWSTSNPSIATVDANGNIIATGAGTATVTATAGSQTASCVVKVSYTWWQMIIRTLLLGFLWY